MIEQFGYVAAFLGAGILFLGLILTLARFIRPDRPNVEKNSTYESGEAPVGNANIRFNPRFYVIALLSCYSKLNWFSYSPRPLC